MKQIIGIAVFLVGLMFWTLGGGCGRPIGGNPVGPTVYTPTPTSSVISATNTMTVTPTSSYTAVPISTYTFTSTPSATAPPFTPTYTLTATPTSTLPPLTFTFTLTNTRTPTLGSGGTSTFTPSPTNGPLNGATPTVTPYYTWQLIPSTMGSGIGWNYGGITTTDAAGVTAYCYVYLAVNRASQPSAGVTLTTPGGDVPVTYTNTSNVSDPGGSFQLDYFTSAPYLYQAGTVQTFKTVTSIGTASLTFQAPGGNVTVSPAGPTVDWDVDGNRDFLYLQLGGITKYLSGQSTSDITPPYVIPASAIPGPGSYTVEMHPQSSWYNIPGTATGSLFTAQQIVKNIPLVIP